MWVRGLKQYGFGMPKLQCESHPMWVRGLKLLYHPPGLLV